LAKLIGGNVAYVSPRVEPKHTKADITKAKELLGWEPEIKMKEGIEELLKINGII
jgi:nucleoside-diphosphate-sugar epimerase